jgi:hypothetical protein
LALKSGEKVDWLRLGYGGKGAKETGQIEDISPHKKKREAVGLSLVIG